MISHIHKYKFDVEKVKNHNHRLNGYTEGMIGIIPFHFHVFYGICSYNNHTHYYSGFTGLPIKTENGHIHRIEGLLEINNYHEHPFSNYTFEDISYIHDRRFRGAFA